MTDLSSKSIFVYDSGLFVPIAQCCAEQFGRVYYHSPCQRFLPVVSDFIVGDGFENITRVDEPEEMIGKVDCWCFTDVGAGKFQKYLAGIGEAVWGHMGADELETDKGKFLKTLGDFGLEVPPHTVIKGMSRLREHLKDKQDLYIKVSKYRGDWETFHWRSVALDSLGLDCAALRFGPFQEMVDFYVFDKIETDIEDGIDAWRVAGQWPKTIFHAMENKDKSLIGALQDFDEVAEPVREINEAFGPALDEYGYQGPFSTEVRIKDDKSYFNDATSRFGSPPHQIQTLVIKNLPQIIFHGSRGEMVEPESDNPIGAQVLITTGKEEKEYLSFDMPAELRPFVKSSFACEVGGVLTIAPNPLENWAGWLVAAGGSIKEVVELLKERKALLPDGFECDITSLVNLLNELESAKNEGIEITDQPIPEPETALET